MEAVAYASEFSVQSIHILVSVSDFIDLREFLRCMSLVSPSNIPVHGFGRRTTI